ncbi:MAG: hypothetical protein KVP17_000751 [Porospora cf. gigantea B]|uniref:uncharacterized protein n=1 Tax=Porospora cf. gigantea B TaxID=2853592 RepID=UPI003571847C|nr:MAG: hypothetical protein KVP17_000751 [Porospora cf. gigantea B]
MPHSDSDFSTESGSLYEYDQQVGGNPLGYASSGSSSPLMVIVSPASPGRFSQDGGNSPASPGGFNQDGGNTHWKEDSTTLPATSSLESLEPPNRTETESSTATFTRTDVEEEEPPANEELPAQEEPPAQEELPLGENYLQPPMQTYQPTTEQRIYHVPMEQTPVQQVVFQTSDTIRSTSVTQTVNQPTTQSRRVSAQINFRETVGDGYVRQVTSRGSRILSQELLEPLADNVRYVEVPVVEEVVRTVPVKETHVVERRVPKQEVHYITKEVDEVTIQYRQKYVEVPTVEYVEKHVHVTKMEDRYVDVVKEVPRIEVQTVEQVVEYPEIHEVPKPYKVVTEQRVPHYIDEEAAVLVSQTVRPVVGLSDHALEVDLVEYEAEPVAVDVHVPKLIHGSITCDERTEYKVATVPSAQYNSILKQLNQHLSDEHAKSLPFQVNENGRTEFLPADAQYVQLAENPLRTFESMSLWDGTRSAPVGTRHAVSMQGSCLTVTPRFAVSHI